MAPQAVHPGPRRPESGACPSPKRWARTYPELRKPLCYGKVWKNAHVSAAQFGGSACPMLVANEHSMSSFPQPLYDTQVIAVVLEATTVVGPAQVVLQALKLCRSFEVVAKSGDG